MTIVIGVARAGGVLMAGDTANTYGGNTIHGTVKVRRIPTVDGAGEVLVGFAGTGASASLLQRHLKVHRLPSGTDDTQAWADGVAHDITRVFAEATPPLLGADSDGEQSLTASVLLGAAGRLWYVFTNQATEALRGYAAIGHGAPAAMGALMVADQLNMEPADCLHLGLSAACDVSPYCAIGPEGYRVESLAPDGALVVQEVGL